MADTFLTVFFTSTYMASWCVTMNGTASKIELFFCTHIKLLNNFLLPQVLQLILVPILVKVVVQYI